MVANNIPVSKDEVDVAELDDESLKSVAYGALEAGKFGLVDECVDEATSRELSLV